VPPRQRQQLNKERFWHAHFGEACVGGVPGGRMTKDIEIRMTKFEIRMNVQMTNAQIPKRVSALLVFVSSFDF
jgi:hypothetical protein